VTQARIVSLSLRDFRNFERLDLQFPSEGLVVVGDNGQGKTNLLEAAYYLSLMRSVRGSRDVDVSRFGSTGFFIDATIATPDAHELSIGFERAGRRKRVRRDGVVVERLSDALGTLPAVMFAPTDVELVSGAPGMRRRYLDIMLALTSRGYLHALQLYRGALERRNAALREAARDATRNTAAVEVWEPPLAEHGAVLVRTRRAWVMRVAERFAEHCHAVGERGRIELRYETSINPNAESLELALAEALAAKRGADLRYGLTNAGPHRDDLNLLLDGRALREFGSAGQQRTAAIALRTLEAETVGDARATAPTFLLDDPFAELDVGRARRVLRLLRDVGLGQTVLAVPRDSDIPRELTSLPRARLEGGCLHAVAS
jgi:DNA replication and repair protein RecF